MAEPGWRIAVDRGGTFTDVVAYRGDMLRHAKVLSGGSGEDPALAGIRNVLGLSRGATIDSGELDQVRLGTTVATNALLTRSGVKTVLVATAGLGDLQIIGDQTRPDLFSLKIDRLPPIASCVIEAHERLSVDGSVVQPLDEPQLRRDLHDAYDAGCKSVAVSLLHGWAYGRHEEQVARVAAEVGFEEIVTSEVNPLRGLVSRLDTVSLDASLSPVVQDGVAETIAGLGDTHVLCMQSSGRLVDASAFRGCRAVLSGPAGGLVGAADEARRHGFDRVVAFDMGGTSTDVSWFSGEFERDTDTVIAGVRVRTPMLRIHTVASGGGSICQVRGGRLRVGPESAGAKPGPACYRQGGPATITDCHVLLGRLPIGAMPAIFGDGGDRPIDMAPSTAAMEDLAAGQTTAMETAEGFLDVAVECIAGAIREVSVQRGHDLRDAALCAFGGAGGQLACRLADRLGMAAVLVPARAGVLSAQGIASADVGAVRRRSVECPLEDQEALGAAIKQASLDAVAELAASGAASDEQQVTVWIRAAGWDRSIGVPLNKPDVMRELFYEACRTRFGFVPSGELVVESVEVDVRTVAPQVLLGVAGDAAPQRKGVTRMWCGGSWQDVPVIADTQIESIDGPAVILHEGATTVLEPGWNATRDPLAGGIVLRRTASLPARTFDASSRADIEVVNRRLLSICREMGMVLQHTAASVNVKERRDYSCAVFDCNGRLVANGPHMPVHLGSMGESVGRVLEVHGADMDQGDAYLDNDPAHGGTHLPDFTVVSPVFDGDELIFVVASRAHHADVGGTTPGSMPADSTTLEEEGVVFDALTLVRGGQLREDEVRRRLGSGAWPARRIDLNIEDLRAQLGANARGASLLRAMREELGAVGFEACMTAVRVNAAACVREMLRGRDGGSFCCPTEDGGEIQVQIDITDGEAVIDFAGTSDQRRGNTNAPKAVVQAAVLYVLRCLVADDIPLNDGCFEPITLRIPEGSMLAPGPEAAVVGGNVETSQLIVDAMLAAFGAQAASQGTMNNLTFGNDRLQYYETLCGGSGGGADFDGTSGVHTHMTNSLLTDPEVLESRFPVRLEQFAIRVGSGGSGLHAGGDGVTRTLQFLEPMEVSLLAGRRAHAPHGLAGGEPASPGGQSLKTPGKALTQLPAVFRGHMSPGDSIRIETPGGGGWGHG